MGGGGEGGGEFNWVGRLIQFILPFEKNQILFFPFEARVQPSVVTKYNSNSRFIYVALI